MKVVVDASALIGGLQADEGLEYYIAGEVLDEIKAPEARLKADLSIGEETLKIAYPGKEYLSLVRKKAEELGEIDSLSTPDIITLAIALELGEENKNEVMIASDDYAIQNMAKALSIRYRPIVEKGISRVLRWGYRCTGCGQRYDKSVQSCEICGGKIKRRPKR